MKAIDLHSEHGYTIKSMLAFLLLAFAFFLLEKKMVWFGRIFIW